MKKTELSYSSAYEELQQIVAALQNEQISIDELPAKIARATELVQFCKNQLRHTEEAVAGLMGGEVGS
ncbi:MAG: exodeoxyribonuclease VII small subunit [Saprospiraceae bacterium]|jgi:exodeoxyribonuclease VII small subunit